MVHSRDNEDERDQTGRGSFLVQVRCKFAYVLLITKVLIPHNDLTPDHSHVGY